MTNTNILNLRKNLPNCILFSESLIEFNTLFNSLRFSTHCSYYFVCTEKISIDKNYIYCKTRDFNDALDISILANDFFLILIHNQEIHYIDCRDIAINDSSLNSFADLLNFIKLELTLNLKINNSADKEFSAIKSMLGSFLVNKLTTKVEKIVLPMFIGFNGKCILLGIILFYKNGNIDVLNQEVNDNFSDFILLNFTIKNTLFSVEFFRDQNDINLNISMNYYNCSVFEILRSIGINVPLILVQNFFDRTVLPIQFVPKKFINFKSLHINYNPKLINKIYIDLDETLIWSATGDCIEEMRSFLYNLNSIKNVLINLITRHDKSILVSLKIANIDSKIFNEIIYVSPGKNKSSFISENSLFIDNDFIERIDALKNSRAISINLDQIDFLKFKI